MGTKERTNDKDETKTEEARKFRNKDDTLTEVWRQYTPWMVTVYRDREKLNYNWEGKQSAIQDQAVQILTFCSMPRTREVRMP